MGVTFAYSTWSHHKIEKNSKINMAFYIYEQPAFSMEHFHPGFCRSLRSMITLPMSRQWSLLENVSEENSLACQSNQIYCTNTSEKKSVTKSSDSTMEESKMKVSLDKINEENKVVEPKTRVLSKPFMSKVSCQETLEKIEIKIQFHGHKFKAENLDVQVVNSDVLIVKAKDDEEKFEKKFKLPSNTLANTLVEKISSKFDVKEEDFQTLLINIPKDVKLFQVPIVMEE